MHIARTSTDLESVHTTDPEKPSLAWNVDLANDVPWGLTTSTLRPRCLPGGPAVTADCTAGCTCETLIGVGGLYADNKVGENEEDGVADGVGVGNGDGGKGAGVEEGVGAGVDGIGVRGTGVEVTTPSVAVVPSPADDGSTANLVQQNPCTLEPRPQVLPLESPLFRGLKTANHKEHSFTNIFSRT